MGKGLWFEDFVSNYESYQPPISGSGSFEVMKIFPKEEGAETIGI